ncbi:hypothetical protein PQX77_007960 [Marasmius sp. AFHP31]|nr:hypothetical protein PQX77_007960 [Marasmius sp. AFHP31]
MPQHTTSAVLSHNATPLWTQWNAYADTSVTNGFHHSTPTPTISLSPLSNAYTVGHSMPIPGEHNPQTVGSLGMLQLGRGAEPDHCLMPITSPSAFLTSAYAPAANPLPMGGFLNKLHIVDHAYHLMPSDTPGSFCFSAPMIHNYNMHYQTDTSVNDMMKYASACSEDGQATHFDMLIPGTLNHYMTHTQGFGSMAGLETTNNNIYQPILSSSQPDIDELCIQFEHLAIVPTTRSGQGEDLQHLLDQLRNINADDSADLLDPVEPALATHENLVTSHSLAGELEWEQHPVWPESPGPFYSTFTPWTSPVTTPVSSSSAAPTGSPPILFEDPNGIHHLRFNSSVILPEFLSPVSTSPSTNCYLSFPNSPRQRSPSSPSSMASPTPLPARGERNAPKFDPEFEEQLPVFFDEFESAAEKAQISNDHSQMKKEVLRYVDSKTNCFWRSLSTFTKAESTWQQFKTEVISYYPDAERVSEATLDQLKKVITDYQKLGIRSSKALAAYHREFAPIASSLISQGVLSLVQASQHYTSVFPESVANRVDIRLQVQFPNKLKGVPYTLNEIKGAVDFLISDASTTAAPVVIKTEPAESSMQSQIQALTELVNKLAKQSSSSTSSSSRSSNETRLCTWDKCSDKRMRDCPDLNKWVTKGRLEFNARGMVVLKGGKRLPDNDKYSHGTLKDCFTRYFDDHPAEKTWLIDSSFTTSVPSTEFPGVSIASHTQYTLAGLQGPPMALFNEDTDDLDEEDRNTIQRLLFKMETRKAAKRKAENASDKAKSTNSTATQPSSGTSSTPDRPEPSQPMSGRIQEPSKLPKPVIGKLPEGYQPPSEHVVGAAPKDDNRNYKYKSPIETEAVVKRVLDAAMASTVSISQADLLAIAPEYRKHMKDSVTARRIGINTQPSSNSLVIHDPVESYLLQNPSVDAFNTIMNLFGDSKVGDEFYVAKESTSIRAINGIVGNNTVHCILDSGCSIVAMSEAACNALHVVFDPAFRIPVQSANGEMDMTLGLGRNVPFRFGDVTAFLQVHIIPSPAYDVLLGRPFDVLTQSTVQNFASGAQHITLHDLNNHNNVTIPSVERKPPFFREEPSCFQRRR